MRDKGERGEKRGTGGVRRGRVRGEEGEVTHKGVRGDGPIENCILSETARCRASGEEVVGVGLRR